MEAQVKSFNETIGKMTMMTQTMMVQQQKVSQVISRYTLIWPKIVQCSCELASACFNC